ncbi:MAG: hypothetical protein CSB21_03215 [Deltaproteobacteria bacterium]|nr:MAG: hypothetical protein CSB21_03215 [Deltaproteobacteria bacterium]
MTIIINNKDLNMFNKKNNIKNIFLKKHYLSNLSPEALLFLKMLSPISGYSALSIGAESHEILNLCLERNLDLSIVEQNKNNLFTARKKFGDKINFYQNEPEDLPFEDNSFEYSFFFNSLEKTNNPEKALEEAFRITKQYVFIGFLNRYAARVFQKSIMNFLYPLSPGDKLFSVFEIKQMTKELLGDVPVKWKTTSNFDLSKYSIFKTIGYADLIQKNPFGAFAGICITVQPRFRVTPLKIESGRKSQIKAVPQGCMECDCSKK